MLFSEPATPTFLFWPTLTFVRSYPKQQQNPGQVALLQKMEQTRSVWSSYASRCRTAAKQHSSFQFDHLSKCWSIARQCQLENYRPYQTTFQKSKIFGEVKEVLEGNSSIIGFSTLATNLKVRFVPSVSLLSCWNHTNTDRSEAHKLGRIALIRPP